MTPFVRLALGLLIAGAGLYATLVNDTPGSPILGAVVMSAGLVLALRSVRHRLSTWMFRGALFCGVVCAIVAAALIYSHVVTGPLFGQAAAIPSAIDAAPASQASPAVEQARGLVRAAMLAQNLPGVSVAVGANGAVVWAEGFGWRDIATRTPVTPHTRFNIGTAAAAIMPAAASLALVETGSDTTADWSPEHIGEPEEDFPGFTFIRHTVFTPLGLAPDQPLAGDRATFYVPRADNDPLRGRRLMAMRDLACCPNQVAFYSTPSDLVRVALATNAANIDGALAGGTMLSLRTNRDRGIVVAIASNIAYARTSELAAQIADSFAQRQ